MFGVSDQSAEFAEAEQIAQELLPKVLRKMASEFGCQAFCSGLHTQEPLYMYSNPDTLYNFKRLPRVLQYHLWRQLEVSVYSREKEPFGNGK